MKEFRLRRDGFADIQKKALVRIIPLFVLTAATVAFISYSTDKASPGQVNVLPFTLPVMLVVIGFSIYRSLKKQKALLETYTLTITDTIIGREQANTPTIVVPLNDVRVIEKRRNGGFVVRSTQTRDVLYIPAQLERYEELEEALNRIRPVTHGNTEPRWKSLRILIPLLLLAAVVGTYTAESRTLAVLSGTTALAFLCWVFYEGRRNKNIDRRSKQKMWWMIVLMISIAVVVVTKLLN